LIPTVLLAGLVAGCGGERAEFSNRDDFADLIPEVQQHIQENVLSTHFGTPTNMIAWERLPIHYHVAEGSLVEGGGSQLTLAISEQYQPIEPGQLLTWLSGNYLGTPAAMVDKYDEATNLLTIKETYGDPAPAAGDRFVVGPGEILQQGRVLYAEHCQHCHGVSGDGNGPTAQYLNPRPRDYRLGKFKFTSTNTSDRASRDDLKTTIWEGIPGTYMPSFKLLTEREMQSIVEYVLWLSMRGEIEYQEVRSFKNDYSIEAVEEAIADGREDGLSAEEARQQVLDELQEYLSGDWVEEFNDNTKFLAEQWVNGQAESAKVVPAEAMPVHDYDSPEAQASRQRGRLLYLSAQAKCATCHGDRGLGDGPQTFSVQKNPTTNEDYPLPGLYDDWGNPLKPRNLTAGIYRGGRRPVDLYRRIYAGIKGTPMPAFGQVLKPQEIWDIVNYVNSIPFESRDFTPGEGGDESVATPSEVAVQTN
jgi:mono/diheme cytochrome c family protein